MLGERIGLVSEDEVEYLGDESRYVVIMYIGV